MSAGRPRVLVLTLYSGEQELERGRASLREQTYTEWDQTVFEYLPNREAHRALRSEIMRRAGEYELFLKLDADMVLRGRDALAGVVALMREHPDVDHLCSAVQDWFTDSLLMGVHVYTGRARWRESDEELFVDAHPEIPGRRLDLRAAPAPFVDHCPDPSPHQAFHFGLHRALKALQTERPAARFSYGLSVGQWRVLRATWAHFERAGDARLGLAVAAADAVLRGRVRARHVTDKRADERALFDELAALSAAELASRLAPRWRGALGAPLDYARSIAPRALVALPRELARGLRARAGA